MVLYGNESLTLTDCNLRLFQLFPHAGELSRAETLIIDIFPSEVESQLNDAIHFLITR